MTQIMEMFKEFNIQCHVNQIAVIDEDKSRVWIAFSNASENLARYVNVIHYAYCEEKRRKSAPAIEHLKIREFNQKEGDLKYDYIINNYEHETTAILFEKTNIPKRQIQKIVLNHKKGIRQLPRCSSDVIYNNFIEENLVDNGCVSVPILSILEIEPELVYDFTTRSENHSFVASCYVTSNCSAETPEGASVGIVKNMSYMTHITIHSNSLPLYEYVLPFIRKIEDIETSYELYDKVKVFINGAWLGISEQPYELFLSLKDKKYKGIINIYTSIVFNYSLKEIRVCNDGGRVTRPVLRVKDKNILITRNILEQLKEGELIWDNLLTSSVLDNSVIEYIDPEEQAWSMIATFPKEIIADNGVNIMKYTHCEIHPSTIFGILASCIPFPEHNQSPRNTYQCAQGKQAMGVYVTNYENRMDKTAYVLNYPARPLVDTRLMNLIHLNKIPSGTNVIVAIMTHTGYNQEDSLIFNKGSIDRGLFVTTIYHTEKDEDKQKINGDEEIRCNPDKTKTKGMKMGNYSKVNSKGVVPENTLIENRDIIIAKVVPIKENRNDNTKVVKFEDQSKIYKTTEETFIDKNYIDRNGEGYNFAKVRLRTFRKPVIGDKFSSRHGKSYLTT
jgi:DNA-directed RNA polymerase beta subunit